MANRNGREALRGAEGHTLDLIFEILPSKQWAELLKAPLELSAAKGRRELAQQLVRAGAEIGGALHEAVQGGHTKIVTDLLESGAPFAAKGKDGHTPLHAAAGQGGSEMVQLLLLKGADKDAIDNNKKTPLYLAASQGHVAVALALLAAGADVNHRCGAFEFPVMHVAAIQGHVDIVGALIERGVNVDAVDNRERTALHYAALTNHAEGMDVLVGAGANIEARDSLGGRTPLHCASGALSRDALLTLLKHGATVNVQNGILRTPLMFAAAKAGTQGAAEVVDSLLRAGADETLVDDDGRNAANLIGTYVAEENRLAEDVERVRELLANAPADRAWRPRGYLVLCRAHPNRVERKHMVIGTLAALKAGSCAKVATAGGVAGGTMDDEINAGDDWNVVVAKVLRVQEEGIFRTIVGYL